MWSNSKYSPIKKKHSRFPSVRTLRSQEGEPEGWQPPRSSSVIAAHALLTRSNTDLPVSGSVHRFASWHSQQNQRTLVEILNRCHFGENWPMSSAMSAFHKTKFYRHIFGKVKQKEKCNGWEKEHFPWSFKSRGLLSVFGIFTYFFLRDVLAEVRVHSYTATPIILYLTLSCVLNSVVRPVVYSCTTIIKKVKRKTIKKLQ